MVSRFLRLGVGFLLLIGALGMGTVVSAAGGAEDRSADTICQEDVFDRYFRQDGAQFGAADECMEYVSQGGEVAYLFVDTEEAGCHFTTAGWGLLPGSRVTYKDQSGRGLDGIVGSDGVFMFSGCGNPSHGSVFATTVQGAAISTPYAIPGGQ